MPQDHALPELLTHFMAPLEEPAREGMRAGFEAAVSRPVTLRANTLRSTCNEVAAALNDAGISFGRVAWYDDALVLSNARERKLWDLPIYQDGSIYLQSLSSMLPPLVLAPRNGADVLDMCAAPGGKTSEMAALAPHAHITACEMKASRADKLEYNLRKLGVRAANIMRIDARRIDEFFSFDQILLDAPCTGTGTYRAGDERARTRMTAQLLTRVAKSQQALLDRALTVLKPGGELVYSTCSILPEENERQVLAALKRHRDCELEPLTGPVPEDAPARAATAQAVADAVETGAIPCLQNELPGTLTVCPSQLFEGFYIAKIKKAQR